jgi:fructuronate reductase
MEWQLSLDGEQAASGKSEEPATSRPRLSRATLDRLAAGVERPSYDRSALEMGVVHIGLGAFHRAHQAPLFDSLAARGDTRWGIVGASLRSPKVRDILLPQDCLYSLTVEEGDESSISIIGCIRDVIVAREAPSRLVEAIAAPSAHLVTITVTEKGYKLDPASGLLMTEEPDVRSDLASLAAPSTMPGHVAAGLALRKERGLEPLTIASCDNIAGNGDKLRAAVVTIARAHNEALADWIEERCAFPNSMVDRIVPATTQEEIASTATKLGLLDLATIRAEPFLQWVIENRLVGPAPELANVGVQITGELAPWEEAKLRLLNGAHSSIAYLGGLAGIATVDQFVAERSGSRFVEMLWDEVESTLDPPRELDVRDYHRALMRRFSNSALGHRTRQIAMDGSQKLPQRLLATAVALVERGREPEAVALGVAAWMRWQGGRTDAGESYVVDDPLASSTARLLAQSEDPAEQVRALMSLEAVFPERLRTDEQFATLVGRHLKSLQEIGAMATVERFVSR